MALLSLCYAVSPLKDMALGLANRAIKADQHCTVSWRKILI